jgi:hypothetical protein
VVSSPSDNLRNEKREPRYIGAPFFMAGFTWKPLFTCSPGGKTKLHTYLLMACLPSRALLRWER